MTAEDRYTLTGPPASQSWVLFHGQRGGYDVRFRDDPDSEFRPGDPVLFRYQVQGPNALALVEAVFGGPLPETKFFHAAPVTLDGPSSAHCATAWPVRPATSSSATTPTEPT